MKLGSGIRVALAAATLFAQLALPVAHSRGVAAEPGAFSNGPAAAVAATSDVSTTAAHDPSLCPICLALSQARVGIGRTLPEVLLRLTGAAGAQPVEPGSALPRAPELVAAPPRAPPVRALSFA